MGSYEEHEREIESEKESAWLEVREEATEWFRDRRKAESLSDREQFIRQYCCVYSAVRLKWNTSHHFVMSQGYVEAKIAWDAYKRQLENEAECAKE